MTWRRIAFENELFFSVASLWEIVIKCGLGREDFKVDPRVLRRSLLDNGYHELPILSVRRILEQVPLGVLSPRTFSQ